MWFKNAQDANMRILRWRLKLAEYDYEVEFDCKIIKKRTLNPNNSEDAQLIAEMLENSDSEKEEEEEEEKEDNDFHLYLSNIEDAEEVTSESNLLNNNSDTLPFTSAELDEPDYLTITEKALIHNPYEPNKIQTRSQTKRENWEQNKIADEPYDNEEEIQEIIKENDPSDKISEDGEENEEDIINQNLKARKVKPAIIENRITKSNIIDSHELLFLRIDNVAYFVDT
ncbi:hypothetical protein ACFW04_007416 [Cataglyphis niger]